MVRRSRQGERPTPIRSLYGEPIAGVVKRRKSPRKGRRSRLLKLVIPLGGMLLLTLLSWNIVKTVSNGVGTLVGLGGSVAPLTVHLHQTYVVQPGDTIAGLAERFGVSPDVLVRANDLNNPNVIRVGQRLVVPSPYHPRLTRQLVIEAAHQFQLDPAFAQAVAYQESGFNENAVSSTGAIGVMQVEPDTGDLVASETGRTYNLGVESDDIHVGIYWLAYLVRYYGGNERSAAAAYYEGQGNLAAHGYLAGTGQYVADVMALRHKFGA